MTQNLTTSKWKNRNLTHYLVPEPQLFPLHSVLCLTPSLNNINWFNILKDKSIYRKPAIFSNVGWLFCLYYFSNDVYLCLLFKAFCFGFLVSSVSLRVGNKRNETEILDCSKAIFSINYNNAIYSINCYLKLHWCVLTVNKFWIWVHTLK